MSGSSRPAFLKLVHSSDVAYSDDDQAFGVQPERLFFPTSSPNTLTFLDWNTTSLSNLIDVLTITKPKMVLDFRVTPRFNLETLNRRAFFNILAEQGAEYVDLFGRIGISSLKDADANPTLIASRVADIAANQASVRNGPFVVLHDDEAIDDAYIHLFAAGLTFGASSWKVYQSRQVDAGQKPIMDLPRDGRQVLPIDRRLIFISHATPQDNDFVLWLTSKLSLAGYIVWSDITQLKGGDTFWRDIEEAIRLRAAKVLFVYSGTPKQKPGHERKYIWH